MNGAIAAHQRPDERSFYLYRVPITSYSMPDETWSLNNAQQIRLNYEIR